MSYRDEVMALPVRLLWKKDPAEIAGRADEEINRKNYALTTIIQLVERRADCADILTIARNARLPKEGES